MENNKQPPPLPMSAPPLPPPLPPSDEDEERLTEGEVGQLRKRLVEETSSLMNYQRAPLLVAQAMHEMRWRNIYAITAIVHLIVWLAIGWPIAAAVGTVFFIGWSISYHRRFKKCQAELTLCQFFPFSRQEDMKRMFTED